jgi:hypothetical protein
MLLACHPVLLAQGKSHHHIHLEFRSRDHFDAFQDHFLANREEALRPIGVAAIDHSVVGPAGGSNRLGIQMKVARQEPH